jgi:hypothetical protein
VLHTGIVASDVELAKFAFRFRWCIEHRLLLRDIDPHRQNPLVRAGENMSCLLDGIFLDGGRDHVRARLSERVHNAEADAGSCPVTMVVLPEMA